MKALSPGHLDHIRFAAHKAYNDHGCKYADQSFFLHIKMVVSWSKKFISYLAFRDDTSDLSETEIEEVMEAACLLHDVIEDCAWTYNDVKKLAGQDVADIVYAVSNELGKSRKERASRTYPKLKKNRLAVYVKLCDRIANTAFSFASNSDMFKKYCEEYSEFKAQLFKEGEYDEMWWVLDDLAELAICNK